VQHIGLERGSENLGAPTQIMFTCNTKFEDSCLE